MKRLLLLLVLIVAITVGCDPANRVVVDTSAELRAALAASSPVAGGGIIEVKPGTYTGCFVSDVSGAPGSPVVVFGAGARLDGNGCPDNTSGVLTVWGHDTRWRDLEFFNSDPDRTSDVPGSDPRPYHRPEGISIYGPRTKIINGWVHDNGDGIGFWSQAVDSELYGVVISNNGWTGPDRGHGHGIYAQNQTGIKKITDVTVIGSYASGASMWATAGYANHFRVNGVITALNNVDNFFVGTAQQPVNDITVTRGLSYQPSGYAGGGFRTNYTTKGTKFRVTDNYLATGGQVIHVQDWTDVVFTGNTLYGTDNDLPNSNTVLAYDVNNDPPVTWDRNHYFFSGDYDAPFAVDNLGLLNWDQWQASGRDPNSTYQETEPPDRVFVRPNRYDKDRASITVFNWSGRSTHKADPQVLEIGQRYTLRRARTMTVAATGIYTGSPITVPTPTEFNALILTGA